MQHCSGIVDEIGGQRLIVTRESVCCEASNLLVEHRLISVVKRVHDTRSTASFDLFVCRGASGGCWVLIARMHERSGTRRDVGTPTIDDVLGESMGVAVEE